MLTFNHKADNNILFFLCQAHNTDPVLAKSSGPLGWVQGRRGGAWSNRGFRFVSTFFKKILSGVQKNKNACLPEWLNVAIVRLEQRTGFGRSDATFTFSAEQALFR
jgi:hypothetical protein